MAGEGGVMDYGSERHRSRFKAWTENHPAEPSIDAIVSEMFIEIERLKDEMGKVEERSEGRWQLNNTMLDRISVIEIYNKKLREALEGAKDLIQIDHDAGMNLNLPLYLGLIKEALKGGE